MKKFHVCLLQQDTEVVKTNWLQNLYRYWFPRNANMYNCLLNKIWRSSKSFFFCMLQEACHSQPEQLEQIPGLKGCGSFFVSIKNITIYCNVPIWDLGGWFPATPCPGGIFLNPWMLSPSGNTHLHLWGLFSQWCVNEMQLCASHFLKPVVIKV